MSDTIIQSGGNYPHKMTVDDHGRAYVRANIVSHMSHHATYHKNAYGMRFDTTLTGTTEVPVMFFYNDSQTKDIEIYFMRVSSDANIEFNVNLKNSYTSGGAEVIPSNTNLSSSILPDIMAYEGSTGGDLTTNEDNVRPVDGFFVGANNPLDINYEGSIVLSPKSGMCVHAIGAIGDKIKITLAFALHGEGTEL